MKGIVPNPYNHKYLKSNRIVKILSFCCLVIGILLSGPLFAQTSTGSGNWSNPAVWGGSVPSGNSNVTVAAGHTINVDINTAIINNLTVHGTLNTLNIASSNLSYKGTLTVTGSLVNNGGIVQTATSNKTFTLSGSYSHNPRNLTLQDESIFTNSNENFTANSNLYIYKWFDTGIPLGSASRVQSSNFGNVTLNIPDLNPWEQENEFMTGAGVGRILGTLTVSSGIVSMDDGVGNSTFMEFNDIIIDGTGSIVFISGPPRPFVLITGNFTDNSTSSNPTVIMDQVFGLTQWNVNGNLTLGHDFYGIRGTGVNPGGTLNMQVTGNFNITGGTVELVSQAAAPLNLTVNGNTSISGSPTGVRFIDGNWGNLNFTTNNFIISGGGNNTLMGGNGLIPQATGDINITINNDFIVNGASNTYLLDANTSTKKLRLVVGHDFIINGNFANITAARSKGAVTVYVVNNCTLSAGKFIGQIDTTNAAIDSVFVGANFLLNSPDATDYFRINYGSGTTYFRTNGNYTQSSAGIGQGIGFTGIYSNTGNMNFHCNGIFNMTSGRLSGIYNNKSHIQTGTLNFTSATNLNFGGGFFRGIDNRVSDNTGTVNFTIGNLFFTGGNFSGYYSAHTSGGVADFDINGLLQITFSSAATDTFTFIGYTTVGSVVSNLQLDVSIAGNFNITGPNGSFISSLANGAETFTVTGNANFSGGKNSFNSFPGSGLPNSHPVSLNFGADVSVFGGSTYFSANNDALLVNVVGDVSVSLGELILQGGNTPADMYVDGGYNQTGGSFFLHKNSSSFSYSLIEVTFNNDNDAVGDFTQSGGVINFDNNPTSTQVFMNINSPNITYSGNGSITMANPGTNIVSGIIRYGKTGISNYNRPSNNHSIQQIEQHVQSGCELTVVTGNMQLASLNNISYNRLRVASGGILDLRGNQAFSNNLQANCGFTLFGRIRTARAQGFYDGTANAAINANGNMRYLMLTNSTVEYNGTNNQIITGIGVGNATSLPQKYYNLEINFGGTPNVEFVYPTNIPNDRTVFVRNELILTNGELNLDNDHIPSSGGRSIIIENEDTDGITRTNGYIRSEVYDSTASVIWTVNSVTGPHVIPFGYNAANYIPFTFNLGSGDADTIIVSTYHTAPTNLPYPPPVIHVNGVAGGDNSANTVDRFWYFETTGSSTDASMTFVCTPAEIGSIVNPRAQCWISDAPDAWQFPLQGAQLTIANGTLMQNAYFYPENWWTLAGATTPLPVTLLDFSSQCDDDNTVLKWSTASELNNHFFSILKSSDGNVYESIGTVNGNGTTNNISYYQFEDPQLNRKISYYKLLQTDYDGTTVEYGPIISNPCVEVEELDITIIPSSDDVVDIIIRNPVAGKFKITLYSTDGKIITTKSANLESGMNIIPLHTGSIAGGIYFVNVTGNSSSKTSKIPLGNIR